MGLLIGIEGIDGSGKTSILEPLVNELSLNNIRVKAVNKRQTNYNDERVSYYAKTLYKLIWHGQDDPHKFLTSQGWLYLHAIWYTLLIENEILPSLQENDVVIVDGWYHKIYAKFLLKENFNIELLNTVIDSIKKCDKVFMLDVDPNISWNRRIKYENNELGGYDFQINDPHSAYVTYQSKIRNLLNNMAIRDNWEIIDNNKTDIITTTQIISKKILDLLNL